MSFLEVISRTYDFLERFGWKNHKQREARLLQRVIREKQILLRVGRG